MTTRAEKDALYAIPLDDVGWLAAEGSDPADRFEIAHLPDGAVAMRQTRTPNTVLRYTKDEWSAYLSGAADGEFDPDLAVPATASPSLR
ncbi:DUF397 domain-containing protein [Streptomyces sp. NPDC051555]|uniref:DUF397 domain-containing protein n=1 Tax=Streptomyces sp. NPDC051555 TaxID=3365657 RepID=UPI0037AC07BE